MARFRARAPRAETVDVKRLISVTPKIHAIFFHVLDFCQENNHSLGFYSEQAVESIRHDFKTIWSNYLIKNLGDPRYDDSLLTAIQQFNARHLQQYYIIVI